MPGIEPGSPGWKPDILTAGRHRIVVYLLKRLNYIIYFTWTAKNENSRLPNSLRRHKNKIESLLTPDSSHNTKFLYFFPFGSRESLKENLKQIDK